MKPKRLIHIFLAFSLLAAVFSIGCTQDELGIFYSLEIESELEQDRGLEDNLKVWDMTKTAAGNYYIAAGTVYTRSSGGTEDWSTVAPPQEEMLSSNILFFDGHLFSIYRTEDGASRLYRRPDTSGATWTEVADADLNGKEIMSVFSAGTALFVCRRENPGTADAYTLWNSAVGDPLNFSQTILTGLSENQSPRYIFDASYDGTDYWVISGGLLLSGTSGNLSEVTMNQVGGGALSPDNFGGIFFVDSVDLGTANDLIFISDKSGNLYTKEEGNADWYVGVNPSTENQTITFYDMELLTVDESGSTVPVLMIGSNNGYYEVPFDGTQDLASLSPSRPDIDSYSTSINYLNTTLSEGTILELFLDNRGTGGDVTDDLMFACTSSTGLWVNNLGDTDRVWSRE
jgi:prepilin-type processing-associated H-X9-DG protein